MKQRIIGSYNKLKETNILSNFFNLSSIQISNILLLLLTIKIITGTVGVDEFGIIMFANKVAQFTGVIINYGTGQSVVKEVAYAISDKRKLNLIFSNTLWIRIFIFLVCLLLLFGLQGFDVPYYSYIVFSIPIVLSEVFNPLSFFLGTEKLKLFNITNLIFNILSVLLLWFFIKTPADSIWVNFILGMGNTIMYVILLIYFGNVFKLSYQLPQKIELLKTAKDNFYLTVNNVSVNLQQSFMLFALATWSNANVLGAYSIGDRVIGQCRSILIIFSNSIYPNAVQTFKKSIKLWDVYRRKTKYILAGVFFTGSVIIFILADLIVFILSNEHNDTAALFLRIMGFLPFISSFNVLNVLDQLLKNNNIYIFRIATILLIISALLAFVLSNSNNYLLIGAFTLIIESCALLMYEYIIKKNTKNA